MATQTDSISIHLPKYETEPIHFNTPTTGVSSDIASIQDFVREKAEKSLVQCKSFEVSLPPSITGITSESDRIKFNSLFQTPTLNELEIVSTNPDGSPIKLNEEQLKAVRESGEFEVNSIHFLGQKHRWKLSKLLQSGVQPANEAFLKELSWAVYMIIIFAKDRVTSNCFSFKSSLRSLKQGFVGLLDAFIGLPAVYTQSIDLQVENERSKFLVIELSPHASEKEMHEAFCAQLPNLFDIMIEHERYSRREHQTTPPDMLPYPHHFVTPNNIDIDLRLHNRDLQTKITSIVSSLLKENTPKNWFNTTKRRLINQYKQEQPNLSKKEVAERIRTELNTEYAERAFETIENSSELEQLSPGLGRLLVAHARAMLTMKSVANILAENLANHLKETREKLIREHPIKSKINRWLERQLFAERLNYVRHHEWDAHQMSIEQCKALGNQQAAYFIQRDLAFRKDHESVLRLNLKSPAQPSETIDCSRRIWLPKHWIVERQYPLPVERVPTQIAKQTYSRQEEEARLKLLSTEPGATYTCRRQTSYSTTTKYPFWRWKLFAIRSFCWLSNTIFTLCLVIPFASPVSFRALFSPKPFYPDHELNTKDLKLYESKSSKTHTFISRLVALWRHVRQSRAQFEQTPDRGFLGKNMQRFFNRFWNYIIKGFIGTVAICAFYPASCLLISTGSFALGLLSPIWMPIVTLLFHILQILFYDANSAGEYSRKLFCLINIVMTDILACGVIQPVLVLGSLIASPIISLLLVLYAILHRCTRGLYDKILYQLIVKRFARIPAHNGFLARRIAGPGLAAEYFYQVSSPEVLAALESLIEQNELKVYRTYMEQILMKPIDDYREFFNSAFQPFSAFVQITDSSRTVYGEMNEVVNRHTQNLKTAIVKRDELLQLNRGYKHDRIRLAENDLTAVLIEGTQLVEKWYPTRIFSYYNKQQIETFWSDQDLEPNDWLGLTSKLLQQIFCRDFLTPLEQTDVYYSLNVEHLTLSKYARMINSANIRDDLDVVTSVYLPETTFTIPHPTFDQQIFNPNDRILDMSTNYSQKRRFKTHGRVYRFVNYRSGRANTCQSPSRFVDYTSITCRFSIPIRLPDVIYVNIIIYNRDNNNATANITLKNLSEQDTRQLIDFQKRFYKQPRLPTYSTIVLSRSMNDDVTTEQ